MSHHRVTLLLALLATAASGADCARAARGEDFPRLQTRLGLCEDINWSSEMLNQHPGLINACREIVVSDGRKWARFEAKFVRVDTDGYIQFSVRDADDRTLEEVLMRPEPGQEAYINDKPLAFRRLRSTDAINLYMPENEYGFATAPGQVTLAAIAPLKAVDAYAQAEKSPPVTTSFAAVEALPARLPSTATLQPWLALTGLLCILAAAGLALRRRYAVLKVGRSC